MNSRKRFACTMQRVAPDRVPIDIGGTPLTGMREGCAGRLRQYLGFAAPAAETGDDPLADIQEWAGADFRLVGDVLDLPGPQRQSPAPDVRVNGWGVRSERVDGEWQITRSPLRGASRKDLATFAWPEARVDENLLYRLQSRAKRLRSLDRHVVVAGHPVFGVLELGCWMCGYDDFLLKMADDPDFVKAFFDRVLEIQLAVIEQYYRALGPFIDVTTSGDDFGMQMGPLLSPAMFDKFVAPCLSERIRRTKALAPGCHYWHHSCGSVFDLVDQLIACGVDILNPIQTSAAKMDPDVLKPRFGERLTFWGAVDVQQFLPGAAVADVPAHVRMLADVLGANGGYVMAPAHQMQDDIPPENIVAWIETIR
jgi:uroporphyrinogen decarboxylase